MWEYYHSWDTFPQRMASGLWNAFWMQKHIGLGGKKGRKGKAYWDARKALPLWGTRMKRAGCQHAWVYCDHVNNSFWETQQETRVSHSMSANPAGLLPPLTCQGGFSECEWGEKVPGMQNEAEAKPRATSPVPILLLWLLLALEFNCRYCWVLCIFKKTKN